MNADVFVDTNLLLYAIDDDPAAASKRQRARQVLLTERWGWSVQVAAEFFVNATSPKRPFRLAAADAAALVEAWSLFRRLI
jgi:predicted nucleic acid-binding protein